MRGEPVFNAEYAKLLTETVLLARPLFYKTQSGVGKGRVLIVVPCLIGEFVSAVPAIRDFIERHPDAVVDLVVAPGQRPLAERIRGVGQVFAAAPAYGKDHGTGEARPDGPYEKIIYLRASPDAIAALRSVPAASIETAFRSFLAFGIHLAINLARRRTPRQWRELNFENLGGISRDISPDELFAFTLEDDTRIDQLSVLRSGKKNVIVHTGSHWPPKSWIAERWVEFLNQANVAGDCHFIFVGAGAVDEKNWTAIAPRLRFEPASVIGSINLLDLAILMRRSDLFVGVDSGPMNLAHVLDVPSVAIFGPGPHFYLPWNPRDIALDKSRGRGLFQMFFSTGQGFIHRITAAEVHDAFTELKRRTSGS